MATWVGPPGPRGTPASRSFCSGISFPDGPMRDQGVPPYKLGRALQAGVPYGATTIWMRLLSVPSALIHSSEVPALVTAGICTSI